MSNKVFRVRGELVEVSDDDIKDLFKAEDKGYPVDMLTEIIRSSLMSQYMFNKIQFDNARDSNSLLTIAQEAHDSLVHLIEYKMRQRLEQMIIDKLEDAEEVGTK